MDYSTPLLYTMLASAPNVECSWSYSEGNSKEVDLGTAVVTQYAVQVHRSPPHETRRAAGLGVTYLFGSA